MKVIVCGLLVVLILCPVHSGKGATGSAQQFYDEAFVARKSGDTLKAQDLAREALNLNRDHVPALLLLAEITLQSSQLMLAAELTRRALKLDANNLGANILCAQVSYAAKDTPPLEECLARAEKLKPNGPDTASLRVQLMIDSDQYGIARRKIAAILREHPQHADTRLRLAGLYLKLRQFEKAEAEFRTLQNLVPGNSELSIAIARSRLAGFFQNLTVSGDFGATNESAEKALESLRQAYANNPDNLAANLMLAELYAVTGRCSEASEHLKKLKATENGESRNIVVFYAFCASAMPEAIQLVQNYLRRHEDDDLTRHQYEILLVSNEKRREQGSVSHAARYHRRLARRHDDQNTPTYMLGELRWAEFLFPGYIEAHRDLMQHFKAGRDYERLADELSFLRDSTQDQKFREMVEQFEIERRDFWYVKEGVENPGRAKNPIPVHIYPFNAIDPLTDHPLGGQAIAHRTRTLLTDFGRVRSISREMAALPQAQKFNPANLRMLRQTYQEALAREENRMPFVRQPLRMVLVGRYAERAQGLEISAELIDAESGIRAAAIEFRTRGIGYLNQAAVRLAQFIYDNSPLSAQIYRNVGDDSVLINVGKREGIARHAEFTAIDRMGRTVSFKTERRDHDIILAKSAQSDANRHLKAGDVLQLLVAKPDSP